MKRSRAMTYVVLTALLMQTSPLYSFFSWFTSFTNAWKSICTTVHVLTNKVKKATITAIAVIWHKYREDKKQQPLSPDPIGDIIRLINDDQLPVPFTIEELILQTCNLNVPKEEELALVKAASGKNPHIVELLLKGGADPNLPDGYKRLALEKAVGLTGVKGIKIVRFLLKRGANPWKVRVDGAAQNTIQLLDHYKVRFRSEPPYDPLPAEGEADDPLPAAGEHESYIENHQIEGRRR